MPRIKRSCIEAIRQRVNLVDVAEAYTQMKRAGSQYRGLSPFNPEKSPSFFIHPEKNVFKDYSSGNAGDLFRFVQLLENLNFHEAVETVARRFGLALEYEDDGMPPERISLRKELFAIHEAATTYFHQKFIEQGLEAEAIRQYWTAERGFSMALAQDFTIGFSPADGESLSRFLKPKGFSLQALRESGLLYLPDHARDLSFARDRFRGRLMIPIRDLQGRVIAFTARVTEQTPNKDPSREAKYINSPETPIFHKSQILFGLERARTEVREGGPLILVEGQLDCLRCWEQGLRNTVAPQGTAITEAQMGLIRRYTNQLECLLDGDSAGQKAALRALPLALKAGLEITFLVLPTGTDPDELLKVGGAAAIETLRASGQTAMTYLAGTLLPNPNKASGREKSEVLEQAYPIVRTCDRRVVRDDYLHQLSRLIQVDEDAVRRDFHASKRTQLTSPKPMESSSLGVNEKLTCVETELTCLALHDETIGKKISKVIDHEWIDSSTKAGAMLLRILAAQAEEEWPGLEHIDELLERDEERNFIYQLLSEELTFEDPICAANECVKRLFSRFLRQRRKVIETAILEEDNNSAKQALFQERNQLRQQTPLRIE